MMTEYNSNFPDFSIPSMCNSFSIPKFEQYTSLHSQFTSNTSDIITEQTFRNNKGHASPEKSNNSRVVWSAKKANISQSSMKNSIHLKDNYSSRGFDSAINSPLKTNNSYDNYQGSYLPLPERLCKAKVELQEKTKQLQEMKGVNSKLAFEVKTFRDKENQRSTEIENNFKRFNIDPRNLTFPGC